MQDLAISFTGKKQERHFPRVRKILEDLVFGIDLSEFGGVRAQVVDVVNAPRVSLYAGKVVNLAEYSSNGLRASVALGSGNQVAEVIFSASRKGRELEQAIRRLNLERTEAPPAGPTQEEILERELEVLRGEQAQRFSEMEACERALAEARKAWQVSNLAVSKKEKELRDLSLPPSEE